MTLTELARLAHVSTSTASKAFALSPEVNVETRNMIFDVAKANGCFKKFYRTEHPGLSFAVICPEFESTYYSSFIAEMQKCLAKYNCEVSVASTGFDRQTEERLIEYYERYFTVDGIIVINGITDFETKNEIPIVSIDCYGKVKGTINVKKDLQIPVNSVVEKWKSAGVREIGFIGEAHSGARCKRLEGAMEKEGLTVNKDYFVLSDRRFEEGGYLGARELYSRGKLPRALLVSYDRMAFGVLRAFSELGVRVPEDVAVVSVDDAPSSEYMTPSLSSINHRVADICSIVADSIMSLIKGEPYESENSVVCEFRERESSRIL